MTQNEFTDFFRHYCARFTSHAVYFEKLDDGAFADIRAAWMEILKSCPLDDAKEAVSQLHRSDSRVYRDQIPGRVAGMCRAMSSNRRSDNAKRHFATTGEFTVECPVCEDTGFVRVHPFGRQAEFLEKRYKNPDSISVAVLCDCDYGYRIASSGVRAARYNPQTMRRFGMVEHDFDEADF